MLPATREFNQRLVLNAMEALDMWEGHVAAVSTGAAKVFQQGLIRLAKGAVKAWRFWLISINETSQQKLADRPPSQNMKETNHGSFGN